MSWSWNPTPTTTTPADMPIHTAYSGPVTFQYPPFIMVPPLTSCSEALIVFGQGVGPYKLYPIAGSWNTTALESIPAQTKAGSLNWVVDFDPGETVTWMLTDAANGTATSQPRTVQTGSVAHCPKNHDGGRSHTGLIVGLVFGFIALALVLGALVYYRRSWMPVLSRIKSGLAARGQGGGHQPLGQTDEGAEEGMGLTNSQGAAFNFNGLPFSQQTTRTPDYPLAAAASFQRTS